MQKPTISARWIFFGEKKTLEESNEPSLIKVVEVLNSYFYVVGNNSLYASMQFYPPLCLNVRVLHSNSFQTTHGKKPMKLVRFNHFILSKAFNHLNKTKHRKCIKNFACFWILLAFLNLNLRSPPHIKLPSSKKTNEMYSISYFHQITSIPINSSYNFACKRAHFFAKT